MGLISTGCIRTKNTGYTEQQFRASYKASDFVTVSAQSGIWTDARNSDNRNKIYVFPVSTVPDETIKLVVEGLREIIKETGRSVEVTTASPDIDAGYQTPEWYQEQTMLNKERAHGKQSNASVIVDLLRSHDKKNDSFIVLITSSDLTTGQPENNFIYGLSSYPYIVISARRFLDDKQNHWGKYADEIYDEAVSLMAAHEFGHYLDLVQRHFNSWIGTGEIVDNHCKGENGTCLMQQSDVDMPGCTTSLEQAKLIFHRERWLCPDCAAEVFFRKEALLKKNFEW
jgi:predicted Zn-dependent protease